METTVAPPVEPTTTVAPTTTQFVPAVEVPAGHVFVMGDHRDRSHDSRSPSFGVRPVSAINGAVGPIYMRAQHRVRCPGAAPGSAGATAP